MLTVRVHSVADGEPSNGDLYAGMSSRFWSLTSELRQYIDAIVDTQKLANEAFQRSRLAAAQAAKTQALATQAGLMLAWRKVAAAERRQRLEDMRFDKSGMIYRNCLREERKSRGQYRLWRGSKEKRSEKRRAHSCAQGAKNFHSGHRQKIGKPRHFDVR